MHAIEKYKCNFGGSVFQVVWSFWISGNQAFKNVRFFPHILLESSFSLIRKPQQPVPYGYVWQHFSVSLLLTLCHFWTWIVQHTLAWLLSGILFSLPSLSRITLLKPILYLFLGGVEIGDEGNILHKLQPIKFFLDFLWFLLCRAVIDTC